MGKLPFKVGGVKIWLKRVSECDNSSEGLILLSDQFAL